MASLYLYEPSEALAGVFAAFFGLSLLFHGYQNQLSPSDSSLVLCILTATQTVWLLEGHLLHGVGRRGVHNWLGPSLPISKVSVQSRLVCCTDCLYLWRLVMHRTAED